MQIEFAKKPGLEKYMVTGYYLKGYSNFGLGNMNRAEEDYNESLLLGEKFNLDQKTARHRAQTVLEHFREAIR